jgi:hypothetical protein
MEWFMTFESAADQPASDAAEDPPVGRELAAALEHGVRQHGLRIDEPLDQHEAYGWYFVAAAEEQLVWCMLQWSGEWLLIMKPEVPVLRRLLGRKVDEELYRRVRQAIHASVASLPSVARIRWFTRQEFERQEPGSETPR